MGVRGLQSFLKQNEEYLAQKTTISATSLVIDANNLLCSLYTNQCCDSNCPQFRDDTYGGDLVSYGATVKKFFETLIECEITPVLVFDGSVIGKHALKDYVASKENEVYRRSLERFNRAKYMEESQPDGSDILMPQSLNTIFRDIASEFGLQRIQTPYEADTHIARIANDLGCPVLTNDSDFLIYRLEKGFIMLDKFDHKNPQIDGSGKSYINCCIYTQDRLAERIKGFNRDNLPLLSALLGNDYVEEGTFDRILKHICNRPNHGIFITKSFSHRRIANLLDWLGKQDLSKSIEIILNIVHPNNRAKLSKIIQLLLRSYKIELTDDFDSELEAIYPTSDVEEAEAGTKPLTPAAFLRRQMERYDLGPTALDMIFKNTHYNYAVLDDFSLQSSNCVKLRPYSLALVLLRTKSYENLSVYHRETQAMKDAFFMFDRLRGEYTKFITKPMQALDKFGSLEHLTCYSMVQLEPGLKRQMLMECFHFNSEELSLITETVSQLFSGEFVSQASLCFLLVKYIGLETKLSPGPQFVNALVLTIFYYATLNDSSNKENFNDETAYKPLMELLGLHATTNNGIVYDVKDKALFRRIDHFINTLNSACVAYCLLNALLDHPCHSLRQEIFFNGTLIYRSTKFLRLNEWTMTELCKDLPILEDICGSIQAQVHCT